MSDARSLVETVTASPSMGRHPPGRRYPQAQVLAVFEGESFADSESDNKYRRSATRAPQKRLMDAPKSVSASLAMDQHTTRDATRIPTISAVASTASDNKPLLASSGNMGDWYNQRDTPLRLPAATEQEDSNSALEHVRPMLPANANPEHERIIIVRIRDELVRSVTL